MNLVWHGVGYFAFGKKATKGCPCGFYNHPERECTGPPGRGAKIFEQDIGPLLDRIDLHVEVTLVAFSELSNMKTTGDSLAIIPERVIKAREIQTERYKDIEGIYCNAQMNSKQLRRNLRDQPGW